MYNGKLSVGDLIKTDQPSIPSAIVTAAIADEAIIASTDPNGPQEWRISRKMSGPNRLAWGSSGTGGEIWLAQPPAKVTFDSVILDDGRKGQIMSAISQLEYTKKIFDEWGFGDIFEKGTAVTLLFWGIPGTGKTLMAQAVADYLNYKLKIYQTADIETAEPGGAERNLREIFRKTKGAKEVILFDECDSLLMDRNDIGPILGAQVNALLTEIEKFDGVIVFTTNRLGKLDPALERRISTKIEFPFPPLEARKAIWLRMIPKKAPMDKNVDFDKLAEYPLTGGNIKNAVLNAVRTAVYQKKDAISMDHFVEAIEKEMEALQQFVGEIDKQTHQHMISPEDYHRGTGTLRITKKAKISKVEGREELLEKALKGIKSRNDK